MFQVTSVFLLPVLPLFNTPFLPEKAILNGEREQERGERALRPTQLHLRASTYNFLLKSGFPSSLSGRKL